MTVAVEETKMLQTVFVAQVLFWVMLLGVSTVKEHRATGEGCTGASGTLVMFVSEPKRFLFYYSHLIHTYVL